MNAKTYIFEIRATQGAYGASYPIGRITLKADENIITALKRAGFIKRGMWVKYFEIIGVDKETIHVNHTRDGLMFVLKLIPSSLFFRYFRLSPNPAKNVVCYDCVFNVKHDSNFKAIEREKDRNCVYCNKECNTW